MERKRDREGQELAVVKSSDHNHAATPAANHHGGACDDPDEDAYVATRPQINDGTGCAHQAPIDADKFRVAVAGMVGNVLEWYDFGIFAYLAPQIGANFFPAEDKVTGIMNTFIVFGVAFIIRPIGGALFGHIGDQHGRKVALQASVALMGVSTFLIGCLPTYAHAGILAPLALSVARLLQGLSVGGEYVGSLIYSVESAPQGRKVLFGSLCSLGVFLGMMLGSCTGFFLHRVMSEEDMLSYGWRTPFLCGLLIAGFALWMRSALEESDEFLQGREQCELSQRSRFPVMESLRQQPVSIVLALFVAAAHSFSIWCILVFPPVLYLDLMDPPLGANHDTRRAGGPAVEHTDDRIWFLNTLILFSVAVASPIAGIIGSRIDVRTSMLCGYIALTAAALPGSIAMGSGNLELAMLGQATLAQVNAWLGANMPAYLVQTFPVEVRYSSLAVGYNCATGLFGGTAGLVATFLYGRFGSMAAVGAYMAGLGCVSTAAVAIRNARTRRQEAHDSMLGGSGAEQEEA